MSNEITVQSGMLAWAIHRAGFDLQLFTSENPNVRKWLDGEKKPTVKQLESFSKKVYLPFGYLLLREPPKEKLPFTFFRTGAAKTTEVNINVYDTILLLQQRQEWLRDYLTEHEFEPLPFVGKFSTGSSAKAIVADMRAALGLPENWASKFATWEEAQDHLVSHIEDKGIITVFNGVVENNTHRPVPVDECRGFVLVDPIAPFMFINNSDYKSAQMFTIVHELAHIWTGHSAGFDFKELLPASDPIERLCDQVAAEFLVPEHSFNAVWHNHAKAGLDNTIRAVALHFKVSQIVIARRALDTDKIDRKVFGAFYKVYANRELDKKNKQGDGGNFYATAKKRISLAFATHVNNAVRSGDLLYRDAYKLTGLKGDTYQTFFEKTYLI